MIINWSLGTYLCEKQLNKYKENICQLRFRHKQIAQTSLFLIGLKLMSFPLRVYNIHARLFHYAQLLSFKLKRNTIR